MALTDELRKTGIDVQRITLEVRIAGVVVPNVISVQVSHGFDQINSQATINVYQKPSQAEELASVEIRAGYNGQSTVLFAGQLSGVEWQFFPAGISLDVRSVLWHIGLAWGGVEGEYTAQDDAAVIRNILEKYGIPNTAANIESSAWTLGVIQPVLLKQGATGQSLISAIDALAGYRTFTIATGVVLRRRISGKAGPSATWAFKKGVDLISAKRIRSLDGVVNHAIVRGLTYEDLEVVGEASAPNPYIPTPPGEAAEDTQSDLVETDAKALEIARRIVGDRNRRPERLELTVIGNPLIQPAATIQVDHPDLGVIGARVFVENVSHSVADGGFTTTIRTTGGNLSGYEPSAPLAQFSLASYVEAEDTGTPPPVRRIVLIADGSGSFDPDGQALTFAWTIAPDVGTATPASGTEPVLRTIITGAATAITVTLVCTDADGLTGTAAQVLPIAAGQQLTENLWSAEGTIIAVSTDGQQTWASQTMPGGASATCLMPLAPAWGQLFGCSDGHVYASFDALSNAPTDLGQPHGAVACTAVWVHETDASRLWAAFSDGQVWFGLLDVATKTATWALRGTLPASPPVEIRESYGTLGELRATAGATEYSSTDAGATWSVGLVGGTTAGRMAAGFDRNAVAFTAGTPAVAFEAGLAAPTITPAPTGGIRGISFGYRQQELYAADGSAPARLYRSDADFTALVEVGSASGLARINHVIRSGNEDGIVYMAAGDGSASTAGVVKALRMATPWYARRTGSRMVHMVGYGGGGQAVRVVNGTILIPTLGSPVGGGGLWVYQNGAWALSQGTGAFTLPVNQPWGGASACPFNPQRWMVWRSSYTTTQDKQAYITEDAGVTWRSCGITMPAGAPGGDYEIDWVVFSAKTPGAWCAIGSFFQSFSSSWCSFVWHGQGKDTLGSSFANQPTRAPFVNLVAGVNGDFVASERWAIPGTGGRLWRIPAASATPVAVGSAASLGTHALWLDRMPGSAGVVGVVAPDGFSAPDVGAFWRTLAYATTVATPVLSGVVGYTLAATPERAIGSGGGQGNAAITALVAVTDPYGAASATPIVLASGTTALGLIRSDRQTQAALAVRSGATAFLVSTDGGATWGLVPGPPGVALAAIHEIVGSA